MPLGLLRAKEGTLRKLESKTIYLTKRLGREVIFEHAFVFKMRKTC